MSDEHRPVRSETDRRHCVNHDDMLVARTEAATQIETLNETITNRLGWVTWIIGIGMSVNLLVVGGSCAYIVGALSSQDKAITIIKERQDRVMQDIVDLKNATKATDHRLDELDTFQKK